MRIEKPLAFAFEDRADVIREIQEGSHANNMRGHECERCGRIHVLIRSQMFTPFSGNQRLPADVVVDVEVDWQHGDTRPPPICSACGVEMAPVYKDPLRK